MSELGRNYTRERMQPDPVLDVSIEVPFDYNSEEVEFIKDTFSNPMLNLALNIRKQNFRAMSAGEDDLYFDEDKQIAYIDSANLIDITTAIVSGISSVFGTYQAYEFVSEKIREQLSSNRDETSQDKKNPIRHTFNSGKLFIGGLFKPDDPEVNELSKKMDKAVQALLEEDSDYSI